MRHALSIKTRMGRGAALLSKTGATRHKILQALEVRGDLPPLPDVILNLQDRVNDPDSDIEKISILIETDPVLSGRLLKLSNSVFFSGGRERVEDLQGALLRLGLKMVMDLVYTSELPKLFKRSKSFDQMQFWKHSLAVGFLTRSIARKIITRLDEMEVSYLCGLMHDLGVLVFDYLIPDDYEDFIKSAKSPENKNKRLMDLEQERFGIAHSELGALFMKKWWPVRPGVINAVEHQYEAAVKKGAEVSNREVVWLANRIAMGNGLHNGADLLIEPFNDGVLEDLGLDPGDIQGMLEEAQYGLSQAEAMLKG